VARGISERLMKQLGLEGARRGRRCRTTIPEKDLAGPTGLVQRRFAEERPNQLWVAGITLGMSGTGRHQERTDCAAPTNPCGVGSYIGGYTARVGQTGASLRCVVQDHINDYGVPRRSASGGHVCHEVHASRFRACCRRSKRKRLNLPRLLASLRTGHHVCVLSVRPPGALRRHYSSRGRSRKR